MSEGDTRRGRSLLKLFRRAEFPDDWYGVFQFEAALSLDRGLQLVNDDSWDGQALMTFMFPRTLASSPPA